MFNFDSLELFHISLRGIVNLIMIHLKGALLCLIGIPTAPSLVPLPMQESGCGVPQVMNVGPPVIPTSILGTSPTLKTFSP